MPLKKQSGTRVALGIQELSHWSMVISQWNIELSSVTLLNYNTGITEWWNDASTERRRTINGYVENLTMTTNQ